MSMDTNDALAHQGHQNELHITLFDKKVHNLDFEVNIFKPFYPSKSH